MSFEEIKTALKGQTLIHRGEEYEKFLIEEVRRLKDCSLIAEGHDTKGRKHTRPLTILTAEALIVDGGYGYYLPDEIEKLHKVWIKKGGKV